RAGNVRRGSQMSALFPRWTNAVAQWTLVATVATCICVPLLLMVWVRTSFATGEHATVTQPIPFDHRVHAHALHIDCEFCHSSVERAATAGIPPTVACVGCHNAALIESKTFAPVRASLDAQKPIVWQRVNALPDFVFFNHSIHVTKGVTCETCHGRVDAMARVEQAAPMSMGWCVNCHRDPASHAGQQVMVAPDVAKRLTNCTTCHR
ncbi:MAG TPA: cytochrome c3 family protein, partial [Gemmatimonadaceae bacterium]|nr:cytochrome c3 family protein [Gemmatimonadaceae bacterium]